MIREGIMPEQIAELNQKALSLMDAETILEFLNNKMPETLVEFVVDEHRERILNDIGKAAVIAHFEIVEAEPELGADAEEKAAAAVSKPARVEDELEARLERQGDI